MFQDTNNFFRRDQNNKIGSKTISTSNSGPGKWCRISINKSTINLQNQVLKCKIWTTLSPMNHAWWRRSAVQNDQTMAGRSQKLQTAVFRCSQTRFSKHKLCACNGRSSISFLRASLVQIISQSSSLIMVKTPKSKELSGVSMNEKALRNSIESILSVKIQTHTLMNTVK